MGESAESGMKRKEGLVEWTSPSNIALVKYWGKYGRQLPSNPSISLTLSKAVSQTSVKYGPTTKKNTAYWSFTFEGQKKPAFEKKVVAFLDSITDILPWLKEVKLEINSSNTFPHSSGIASSASSMSALAMCLMDVESQRENTGDIDLQKSSHLARLGSGSASRSVYGPIAIWGDNTTVSAGANEHAIPFIEKINPVFNTYHDDILIISKAEKAVSSRAGHALMENNPYAQNRFEQAHRHLGEIISAMQSGDLEKFGGIVEREALTLHALMMASDPPYMLMEPHTLSAINEIKQFRREKNLPVYFTLDAGPNIHLLYPHDCVAEVEKLKIELSQYCAGGTILNDQVGNGPVKLK